MQSTTRRSLMSRRKVRQTSRLKARVPGCIIINKLINCVMKCGKKKTATKLVRKALGFIEYEIGVSAIKTLHEAIDNVTPYTEVRQIKVGGVSYSIPVDVTSKRRLGLAIRWIVISARRRREVRMWIKLAWELIDSALRRSEAWKRRESLHSSAVANQAFAHLGW
ncbi:MAG: small ribosomal subunit protein uS7 [Candidatus Hodgkinia cicadicola]